MERQRVHVLLVEDNPADARLVELQLLEVASSDFRITKAARLGEALSKLSADSFDVVLLDLSLPDSHGLGTIRKVLDKAPTLPIVVLTGFSDESFGVEAVQQGAQDYLIKGEGDGALIARSMAYAIQRKQIQEDLRDSENRYKGLVTTSPDAIVVHCDGEILFCNESARLLFGAASVQDMVGRQVMDFVPPAQRRAITERVEAATQRGEALRYVEEQLLRVDGQAIDVEVGGGPISFRGHPAVQLVIRDIRERKRAEEEQRLAKMVFETTTEAIMVTDSNHCIKVVNPAFTTITGYRPAEVVGQTPAILRSGRQDEAFYENMWKTIDDTGRWEGEIWNRRKDGEVYPEWLSIAAMRGEDGVIHQYVAVFSDITKRKKDEEQIKRQANYDALTELPNRTLFFDRLAQAIEDGKREHQRLALLFIDLDRFKVVNDTLGHLVGDRLLQKAAERLHDHVRASDTVARLGGDEFTVILRHLADVGDAAMVAEKIIESLSEPFLIDGNQAFIGASIGITIYPDDADDALTMLRNADVAMYRAKEGGRNIYRFFTQEMDTHALVRLSLENELRDALENDEFEVFYQPIVATADGKLVGAESLVRWRHPKRGLVSPGEFIPIAEDMGLIAPLGERVLWRACDQGRQWLDRGLPPLRITVNVSSRQIKRGLSPERVTEILRETRYPAGALTFEITESLIMEDTEESIEWLSAVKKLGVGLSIDDFGTGYSSLSYLKRFPVDTVKIDRSFVRDITSDPEDAALVEAIVLMGRSMGLKVVAEGVETSAQLDFLREAGCVLTQGYYFSTPLTADDFVAWGRKRGDF